MTQAMIAVYGGTFDPFHLGHAHVLKWLLGEFSEIIVVPNYQNPLKKKGTLVAHRLRMIQLGVEEIGSNRISISTVEVSKTVPSFTIDTLKSLRQTNTDRLCLIVGSDAALEFGHWKSYERILEVASLLIVRRQNFDFASWARIFGLPEPIGDTITLLSGNFIHAVEIVALDISATRLRAEIAGLWEENSLKTQPQGIQRSVWHYIKENKLYTDRELR